LQSVAISKTFICCLLQSAKEPLVLELKHSVFRAVIGARMALWLVQLVKLGRAWKHVQEPFATHAWKDAINALRLVKQLFTVVLSAGLSSTLHKLAADLEQFCSVL